MKTKITQKRPEIFSNENRFMHHLKQLVGNFWPLGHSLGTTSDAAGQSSPMHLDAFFITTS